jgi:acyl-CoA thioester hydrolase
VSVFRFVHRLRVRYHECDPQQIVFNSRYLEYFDIAMTEYLRALGWDYLDLVAGGCDPSLVRTSLDFHEPATFDEELNVGVRTTYVGTSSFRLAFEIRRAADAELLTSAETTYVNVDPESKRSRPVPEALRERMLSYEQKEIIDGG